MLLYERIDLCISDEAGIQNNFVPCRTAGSRQKVFCQFLYRETKNDAESFLLIQRFFCAGKGSSTEGGQWEPETDSKERERRINERWITHVLKTYASMDLRQM